LPGMRDACGDAGELAELAQGVTAAGPGGRELPPDGGRRLVLFLVGAVLSHSAYCDLAAPRTGRRRACAGVKKRSENGGSPPQGGVRHGSRGTQRGKDLGQDRKSTRLN